MNNLRKRFLVLCLVFLSGVAYSQGTTVGGKIVHVATVNGAILFKISGSSSESNRPACATTGRYAVPEDSGHASAVLMAYSRGDLLGSVRGTGNCTLSGNSEDIEWIEVCPISGC